MKTEMERYVIKDKQAKFLKAVKKASDFLDVKEPHVKFWDGVCPEDKGKEIAHIHLERNLICISNRQLRNLYDEEIYETATHEVTHIAHDDHGDRFHEKHADIKSAIWGSSEILTYGKNDRSSKIKIDRTRCNYHLCRKKSKMFKCKYCSGFFCKEHSKPKSAGFKKTGGHLSYEDHVIQKELDRKDAHPCFPYVNIFLEKIKENPIVLPNTPIRRQEPEYVPEETEDEDDTDFDDEDNSNDVVEEEPMIKPTKPAKNPYVDIGSAAKKSFFLNKPPKIRKRGSKPEIFFDVTKLLWYWIGKSIILIKTWIIAKTHDSSFDYGWFFKNLTIFAVSLAAIITISANMDSLNSHQILFIRLGSSLFLVSLFFIGKYAHKTFNNIKYAYRRLSNFRKSIAIIVIALLAFSVYSAPGWYKSNLPDGVKELEWGDLNPLSDSVTEWFTSNTTSNVTSKSNYTSRTTRSESTSTKSGISIELVEFAIHDLVNQERKERGLTTLKYDDELADIARDHSRDMAQRDFFDHENPDGEDPTDRAEDASYRCYKDYGSYYTEGIAENIAMTPIGNVAGCGYVSDEDDIAECTVDGWMTSKGHRENILTETYDKEGIGVYKSGSEILITQNFC